MKLFLLFIFIGLAHSVFASAFEEVIHRELGSGFTVKNIRKIWRLPALQKAIRGKQCITLSNFMAETSDKFYEDDSGLSYALARYLCFYLQELGKLQQFYKSYRDKFSSDGTSRKMLEQVTGKKLAEFEKSLHSWVLQLNYN